MKINCPKCKSPTIVNISNAIDENGEMFVCNNCGWPFMYVENK